MDEWSSAPNNTRFVKTYHKPDSAWCGTPQHPVLVPRPLIFCVLARIQSVYFLLELNVFVISQ